MKKNTFKQVGVLGVVALASATACAQGSAEQSSSVQLYGIVDLAYRHTTNEGTAANPGQSLNQMVGGGMSQSRWGINVTEDLGGGLKALVNMENRFTANNGANTSPAFQQSCWVYRAVLVA